MLLKKSARGRMVLGQDGLSREMMGKGSANLLQLSACGAGKCASAGCPMQGTAWCAQSWRCQGLPSRTRRGEALSISAGKEY